MTLSSRTSTYSPSSRIGVCGEGGVLTACAVGHVNFCPSWSLRRSAIDFPTSWQDTTCQHPEGEWLKCRYHAVAQS